MPLADVRDLHAGKSSQRSGHAAQCATCPVSSTRASRHRTRSGSSRWARIDIVNLDETSIGRFIWEPGWRWSEVVKPVVDTPLCVNRHLGYVIGGHLHVVMDDGTELDIVAGDAYEIPPGHDAWVVGDTAFDAVEFASARSFGIAPDEEDERTLATILFTDIVDFDRDAGAAR